MILLTATLSALATLAVPDVDTWPGFRGDGSGTSHARSLPLRWSPEAGIAWKVEIPGYGQSSPVVRDGRVFVTSVEGANMERCFVHAFDLDDGSEVWSREFAASQPVENYFRNSRAAPTCVVDAQYVWALFAGGNVLCLTHEGETEWTRSLVEDYGPIRNERGLASSLAQTEAAVVALVDHDGPSYLVAFDKRTGQELWKVDRGERGAAWASPITTRRGDREMVIVSSAGSAEAYDGGTGAVVWRLEGLVGNRIPSASLAGDDLILGATQSAHGTDDPRLVRRSNRCMRWTNVDGYAGVETRWTANRADPHYSTPLAYMGRVYYVSSTGILTCLDQETGEKLYATRIAGASWASAIGAEGRVYLFLKDGTVLVLEAGPEFVELATNRLWKEGEVPAATKPSPADIAALTNAARDGGRDTDAAPDPEAAIRSLDLAAQHRIFSYYDPVIYGAAAVDGRLLVRTGQTLYCVEGTPGEEPGSVDR